MREIPGKKTILALAVSTLLGMAACGGGGGGSGSVGVDGPVVNADVVRSVTPLMAQWRFIQDDKLTDSAALENDGRSWATVNLPHTWNEKDAASTAQTTPTSKDYKRGLGWYRLEFDSPKAAASQWLQFDAVSVVADVWLNGEKLGQHKGAFAAFRFDVSGKLKAGKNVLLVKADNTLALTGTDRTAIAPLAGDFNLSGGIYRGVSLIGTRDAAFIELDDFGSSGVYARTTSVDNGQATVNVRTKLANANKVDGNYTVVAALLDASDRQVRAVQKAVTLKAGAAGEVAQDVVIDNARLWHGMADPYLYKLVVELRDASGNTLDKVVQDFGIRTMAFDPDKGFFLNGKSVPLRGVNMHQDFQDKAWAISNAETDLSLALIKEVGANTIRLAHYPHGTYTMQQSDKLGFVTWAEIPYVNQSLTNADCKITAAVPKEFSDNLKMQLQEMIRQHYNHASVGTWGLANEIGNSGVCMGQDTVTPLMKELHTLAKQEDPGRMTTEADSAEDVEGKENSQGSVFSQNVMRTGGMTDIWALNRYFGFYFQATPAPLESVLTQLHARYPKLPVGISEYGAGAAVSQQTDNPRGGKVCSFDLSGKRRDCYQPEGHAAYVHEESYRIMDKPYVWGTYLWNMFDFGSGIRHEGDIGGTNTKGLVTFDRRTKKDAFFFYKANWSSEPVTYIAGRRYVDRAYRIADIKVYHNGEGVTLKLNGKEVGRKTAADCNKKVCEFKGVTLDVGSNNLVAEGLHQGKTVTDTVGWKLAQSNADNIYIAAGQLATGFISSKGERFGSDNFFVGGLPLSNFPIDLTADMSEIRTMSILVSGGSSGITDTRDLMLYDQMRVSDGMMPFAYDIPLANGNYAVTLGFVEPTRTAAVGSRVFNVEANDATVISNLDIFAEAGKHRTIIAPRTFNVTVNNGRLNLNFKPVVGGAAVSNIRIVKQ